MHNIRSSFAFLVLAYNHQEYIIEHLESIKYLVKTHGADLDVDLIVSDDCSRDDTQKIVNLWIESNQALFRSIKTIYNPKNLGTCACVNNMLEHMVADRCKLTAGDDVYSFENVFKLTEHDPSVAMVSGRTLHLINGELGIDRLASHMEIATQVIYDDDSLSTRFKHLSYNNAPNIIYATECLMNSEVRKFLVTFDVTEDWPLQVGIAQHFSGYRFELIKEVLVYYRRTSGSTYIVASGRFVSDKVRMYDYLIHNESSWINRMRLISRKLCFKSQNRWVNKFLNIDFYVFFLSYLWNLTEIAKFERASRVELGLHEKHYKNIFLTASGFREGLQIKSNQQRF